MVDPEADWVAEHDELPSDAGDADEIVLEPRKIGNVVEVSNEVVEDSPIDQLDAIGRAMVRGLVSKVDARFFSNGAVTAIAPAALLPTRSPARAGLWIPWGTRCDRGEWWSP